MSKLSISLKGELLGGGTMDGIPVRVVPADRSVSRPEPLTVSLNGPSIDVDVAPGHYMVEAMLPSGDVVQRSASVDDGVEAVALIAPESANEFLSWSRMLTQAPQATQRYRAPVAGTPVRARDVDEPDLPIAAPAQRLSGTWQLLVDDRPLDRAAPPRPVDMDGPTPGYVSWHPDLSEHGRALAFFPTDHDIWSKLEQGGPGARFYVRGDATEETPPFVACLPIPWAAPDDPWRLSTVRVVREAAGGDAVLLEDPYYAAILAFLAGGNFDAARRSSEVVPSAESALYAKRSNTLAAAAGGYILLQLREYDRMHDWPSNLADWFRWLPDAQIVYATFLMRTRPKGWHDEARARLLAAAAAGVPLFSIGIRFLRDGLAQLPRTDSNTNSALAYASELAAMSNADSVFTWLDGTDQVPVAGPAVTP